LQFPPERIVRCVVRPRLKAADATAKRLPKVLVLES